MLIKWPVCVQCVEYASPKGVILGKYQEKFSEAENDGTPTVHITTRATSVVNGNAACLRRSLATMYMYCVWSGVVMPAAGA